MLHQRVIVLDSLILGSCFIMTLGFYVINLESILLLSSVGMSMIVLTIPIAVIINKFVMRVEYFDFKRIFAFQVALFYTTLSLFLYIDNWR